MNSNERPLILLSVLFSAGFLLIIFYLIIPKYSGAGGFMDKEQVYKAKSAELDNLKNYHAGVSEAYQNLENAGWSQKKEKININFTSSDPMFLPKMYSFFQQRCLTNGMYLDSIVGSYEGAAGKKNQSSENGGRVKQNQFSLNLSGSYVSFKNLLADFESQALLINVQELGFSSQASASPDKKGKVVSGSMPFNLRLTVPSY